MVKSSNTIRGHRKVKKLKQKTHLYSWKVHNEQPLSSIPELIFSSEQPLSSTPEMAFYSGEF